MNETLRDTILELVNESIDMEGDIVICGCTFSRSYILKKLEPIAYNMAVQDIVDSTIEDIKWEIEHLDPDLDAEKIVELQERLEEFESI